MCIHVLSFSFYLQAFSFHVAKVMEMALWLGQGTERNKWLSLSYREGYCQITPRKYDFVRRKFATKTTESERERERENPERERERERKKERKKEKKDKKKERKTERKKERERASKFDAK